MRGVNVCTRSHKDRGEVYGPFGVHWLMRFCVNCLFVKFVCGMCEV
jgi:hypothetical protein